MSTVEHNAGTPTPAETASGNSENMRNFTDDDFRDYFAQTNMQLPALQCLQDFQTFYAEFFELHLGMTTSDRRSFLKLFIDLKNEKIRTQQTSSSPSSTKPVPTKAAPQTPVKQTSVAADNTTITDDGYVEWDEGMTRLKGNANQYLNSKENRDNSTPVAERKIKPVRTRTRSTGPVMPTFDDIKQQIRGFDHNSTRGKHRSAFYTERDVVYMRTQRGNRNDTELMRRVGAGFDWPLKLWWVPNDCQLSAEYEKFVLDAEENAGFNALHDQVMHMLDEDEE